MREPDGKGGCKTCGRFLHACHCPEIEAATAPLRTQLAEVEQERDDARAALADFVDPDKARLVSFVDGQWDIRSPIFPTFVCTMAQMLEAADAKNYIEMEGDHATVGPIVLTIQRKFGKKPHELRVEAERQRDEIVAMLDGLPHGEGCTAGGVDAQDCTCGRDAARWNARRIVGQEAHGKR